MDLNNLFDTYGRQARLQPALLALFPVLITAAVWVPALYQTAAGLLGLVVACGVTGLLAHFARAQGRAEEVRLYAQWGGKPTTIWLRHRDDNLDVYTKRRYHSFLREKVRDWKPPTEAEEQAAPSAADTQYETAVRWLLEYTRDSKRYPLVFRELVSYGFRRNLLGIKAFGLSLALACSVTNGVGLFLHFGSDSEAFRIVGIASLGISFLATVTWLKVVNQRWVRDAADAYAKALLAACESVKS